jgi:serine/threonine protein kinase
VVPFIIRGAFGVVRKAIRIETEEEFAIKILSK